MHQNLIAFAGLSHSGKDLLFNQIMKLGRSEPDLKIAKNIIYYDWLKNSPTKKTDLYITNLFPAIREKILMKINTLVYIHDISYQLLDEITTDFQEILSNISKLNKHFQVILLLNRGHLIPNEVERNKVKNEVLTRLQHFFPQEIPSYIVSLKGPDEQRLTNHIFTQIIHKASDFGEQSFEQYPSEGLNLSPERKNKIAEFLKEKMKTFGFAGAYLLSENHDIKLAVGKSQGWENKVGPQIIRMLDQDEVFDIAPKTKTNILRIEDFLMITQAITMGMKLILIGMETTFTFNAESYSTVEQICLNISEDIISMLQ